MKLVFMGTPQFAVPSLEKLVQGGYQVAGVVTQPDRPRGRGQKLAPSPIKEVALAYHLPLNQPESMEEEGFFSWLEGLKPEVIVVVAFGQKIPSRILHLPPRGCINLHASLLPRYRGAAPINWAIMQGEQVTGVSTIFMDEGWDTGDLILQREVPIGPEETAGELHDRLAGVGADLLEETLNLIRRGEAPRTPQNHALATYAPRLTEKDGQLEWGATAISLFHRVRGLAPRPGAWTLWRGGKLRVLRARPGQKGSGRVGEVVRVNHREGSITVATGEGTLDLFVVQPENRGVMTASAFAIGHGLEEGMILGEG